MENKNEIVGINSTALIDPKKFVSEQTPQQAANMYIFIDEVVKKFKNLLREKLLNGKESTFEWKVNGKTKSLRISRAGIRYEDYIETSYNWPAVMVFAKENGYEVPMTTPEVDIEKLKMTEWFQENVEKFVHKEIKQKKIESNNMLKVE